MGWLCCTIFMTDRISGSSKQEPTTWIPTGNPSLVCPAGTLPPRVGAYDPGSAGEAVTSATP